MIKTIIKNKYTELDEEVNNFMKEIKQNCAVRTETFVISHDNVSKIYHKAVIFYNEEENKKPTKIGALWKNEEIIKGKINNKNFQISVEDFKALPKINQGKLHKELNYEGNTLKIYKNEYKKEDKQPDFVVYK